MEKGSGPHPCNQKVGIIFHKIGPADRRFRIAFNPDDSAILYMNQDSATSVADPAVTSNYSLTGWWKDFHHDPLLEITISFPLASSFIKETFSNFNLQGGNIEGPSSQRGRTSR
jgi:hypothetical protein